LTKNIYEYIFIIKVGYYLDINFNKNNMPGLDGTGPLGQGPRTGRGFGYCPRGRWGAAGWGGYGYGPRRFISPKNKLQALEEEERMLEEELAAIREEKESLKNQQ